MAEPDSPLSAQKRRSVCTKMRATLVMCIEAITRRDYPVVQGGILISATLVILVNLTVDLLQALLDPRIRHA